MSRQPMEDDERRCTATSKQSRERCKRWAIPGGTVCVMHGGATPVVRAAAEARIAQADAEQVVEKLWAGLDKSAPVTDPVSSLQRLAGALEQMANVLGTRVNDMKSLEAGDDLGRVRAHATALDRVIGHLRGLLADMVRLGIAQQQLQLERDKARLVGVAVTEAQDAVGMSAEDRETFTRVLLARLRVELEGAA